MNICGIIAEYNPFHNGHNYHLQKSIEQSEADYTVVVMSGNFVQRGAPAMIDKFTRTKAALSCGADLVLELPVCYSAGSAEYFSFGAISLLDKLGVISHLCFGSECGDIESLKQIAHIYSKEPDDFQVILRQKLKTGLSFPVARASALIDYAPEFSTSLPILSSPNNILGIEYIKALQKRNSTIHPITIQRSGCGYHDPEWDQVFSSASAIRQALENGISLSSLFPQFPDALADLYDHYFQESFPLFTNDLSSVMHYKLLSEMESGYTQYMDVSQDLSDRIQKNVYRFTTFSNFCDLLKTKELTFSRISRALLHILLDLRKSDISTYVEELDYVPYARILGFRKDSAQLLREIRTNASIPLISKLADAGKTIDGPALQMLQKNIMTDHIYNSIRAQKNHTCLQNEYSSPIVII